MEILAMASRFTSVRDRNLSLWQSAVDEAVSAIGDPIRAKAMRDAVALQALSGVGKAAPIPDAAAAAAPVSPNQPSAHALLAKAFFDRVNADHGPGAAAAAFGFSDMLTIFRDYSTADVLGWAQCAIN